MLHLDGEHYCQVRSVAVRCSSCGAQTLTEKKKKKKKRKKERTLNAEPLAFFHLAAGLEYFPAQATFHKRYDEIRCRSFDRFKTIDFCRAPSINSL